MTMKVPTDPTILSAQNPRLERLERLPDKAPVEDRLPWSQSVNSFILNNALASVGGLWALAMFNPSIRLGLAEEFREAAKRDRSPRGQLLAGLSKTLDESAEREFRAAHTRPSAMLMAQGHQAAQNLGEKLIMNIVGDAAVGGITTAAAAWIKGLARVNGMAPGKWLAKLQAALQKNFLGPDAREIAKWDRRILPTTRKFQTSRIAYNGNVSQRDYFKPGPLKQFLTEFRSRKGVRGLVIDTGRRRKDEVHDAIAHLYQGNEKSRAFNFSDIMDECLGFRIAGAPIEWYDDPARVAQWATQRAGKRWAAHLTTQDPQLRLPPGVTRDDLVEQYLYATREVGRLARLNKMDALTFLNVLHEGNDAQFDRLRLSRPTHVPRWAKPR